MPRDSYSMPICSPGKLECVEKAIFEVETSVFDMQKSIGAKCACLPACTEMKFPFLMTQSVLHDAKSLQFSKELLESNPKLKDMEYIEDNVAIVHIYHESLHFLKQERGEVSFKCITYIFQIIFSKLISFSSLLQLIYYLTLEVSWDYV